MMPNRNTIPLNESFRFCPHCGTRVNDAGNNPLHCQHCGFVFYFSPVAAVGGIILAPDSQLLFLVRGKDPGKGKLGLPGGFVDPGETLESSLKREVLEETSLVVKSCDFLCSYPNQYDYRGISIDVLDTFFTCVVECFDPLEAQAEEVDSFVLSYPDEPTLNRFAFPSNRRAIEYFLAKNSL